MKNLFITFLCVFALISVSKAQSDTFKNFRFDFGVLYAVPGADALDAGGGFYLNPKFHLNDNILVGLKYEGAVLGSSDSEMYNVSISMLSSMSMSFDYYFNSNAFRPYVGVSAGTYSLGSVSTSGTVGSSSDYSVSVDLGSKLGFAPKCGFTYKHFDMGLQYNMILGSDDFIEVSDFNYLAIKLGFHFGGGRR